MSIESNLNDLEMCAMEFYASKDYCSSIKLLTIACKMESRTRNTLMLALNYMRIFRYDIAKECLNVAYQIDNNRSVSLFMGYVLIMEGNYEESFRYLERYIDSDPNGYLGFLFYGVACYRQKKFDVAIKCFDEADMLSKHECDAVCLYKAKTYFKKSNPDRALYYILKMDDNDVSNSIYSRTVKNLFEEIYVF